MTAGPSEANPAVMPGEVPDSISPRAETNLDRRDYGPRDKPGATTERGERVAFS